MCGADAGCLAKKYQSLLAARSVAYLDVGGEKAAAVLAHAARLHLPHARDDNLVHSHARCGRDTCVVKQVSDLPALQQSVSIERVSDLIATKQVHVS